MTAWLNGALAAEGRPPVSKHTVHRLMGSLGMNGLSRGRTTRTTVPGGKDARRAGDLLNRQFCAPRPNHAWVTDFTYVATWSGFIYVALAMDLYSRAIVGCSASTIKDVAFVEDCLAMDRRRDQAGRPVHWYNHQRLHGELDYRTPEEYEQAYCVPDRTHHPGSPHIRRRHEVQSTRRVS
jgi:putative transposase